LLKKPITTLAGPHPRNKDSERNNDRIRHVYLKRDRIDFINTIVVIMAFLAAVYAGKEAKRLADLTQTSIANASADSIRQAADTQSSLALTKQVAEAAKASASEVIAERRPFVGIDEKEIIINKPLTFDKDGASINFDLWFHNTGKSAAINTSSVGGALSIAPLVELPIPPQGPAAEFASSINCNKDKASVFTSMGTIILPGAGSKYNIDWVVKQRDFRLDPNGLVSAWFPLCIVYKDDEGKLHGTGFILFLKTDDGKQSFSPTGTIKGQFKILSAGESVF
jgi:hypothetical protein